MMADMACIPLSVVLYASRTILETHWPFSAYECDSIAQSLCPSNVVGRDPVYGASVDDVHRPVTAIPDEVSFVSSMELTDRTGWGAQLHRGKQMVCNEDRKHNVLTR